MASQGLARHLFEVEKRRVARDDVFLRTTIRLPGSQEIPAEIINISRFGFMARMAAIVAQEASVDIRLPDGSERRARVAWALGNRIGAEFRPAMDAEEYRILFETLDNPEG
ncbi:MULTISPECIES: hypothetical protein [Sphingomonadales]|uniref:PilZ domain-containing protein n=2 Tax=Edaphosphingomonas TaxID=3423724 RepID=A0A2T4HR68_9SPHN|nr:MULTISPECIES: hypothetical protein [Sphingomonas]AGH48497.1 hypothetical protein G432_03850 [Sphingomonas sp. MM-1]MDX3883325.1 hypothetical protein [Sphingomonas sp.]OHT20970.1 hypothetical protein BHE75_02975 [Sphingomonas haloaromaticamans]PTD18276.1 hypothetical protein CV103_15290 [Sphingomonas fennica]